MAKRKDISKKKLLKMSSDELKKINLNEREIRILAAKYDGFLFAEKLEEVFLNDTRRSIRDFSICCFAISRRSNLEKEYWNNAVVIRLKDKISSNLLGEF